MPNSMGRFHLYSDTSKFTAGSALYQTQNEKLKLEAYASSETASGSKKLFNHRIRIMWFGHKYSYFLSFLEKSVL